jgi:hypothetical protein
VRIMTSRCGYGLQRTRVFLRRHLSQATLTSGCRPDDLSEEDDSSEVVARSAGCIKAYRPPIISSGINVGIIELAVPRGST